jgi:D-lactate dehydrogenase
VSLTKEFDAVCVFVNDTIDAKTIAELAKNGVQIVALRCAGFNNVDLEAAEKHNITIVRVPAYSPHAVAEHAIALLFTLNRKTHKAYNRIRESNFSLEKLIGFDVYGKTVGIIGTGNIGRIFAEIIKGFGCRVLLYDIYPSEELQEKGFEYVSLEQLYKESDIISLHCPLTEDTKHIINAESFRTMKQGVVIINTSRGGLINSQDAIEALKTEKLGALGIDVYEQEEHLFFKDLSESIIQDDVIARLTTFPNVLITSHQGFFTQEALTEIAETTLSNIANFEKGEITNQVEF